MGELVLSGVPTMSHRVLSRTVAWSGNLPVNTLSANDLPFFTFSCGIKNLGLKIHSPHVHIRRRLLEEDRF